MDDVYAGRTSRVISGLRCAVLVAVGSVTLTDVVLLRVPSLTRANRSGVLT